MKIKNLFFISDEFISRKQLFQITDMGYHIWSFVIGQLQSDGSIWNPKQINKVIYTEFFTFSPNHFTIFTQTVIIYTYIIYIIYLYYLHYLSILSILSIYIIYLYYLYYLSILSISTLSIIICTYIVYIIYLYLNIYTYCHYLYLVDKAIMCD